MSHSIKKRFIHFGCWNNSGCDVESFHTDKDVKSTDTALTRVMKEIKKNIASSRIKPEFMSIAGDNYYPIIKKDPITKEKNKILDEHDLLSGFDCLPKGLKKYLLIGNHDLEKLSNKVEAPSACQILDMQKELEEEPTNNFEMDDLKSPFIMNTKLSDSTIVIMLDTSMYSNEDKNLKKVEHCYQRLFEIHGFANPNKDTIKNVRELQKKRTEAFVDTLTASRVKNIIVVGHHPMVCFKTDEVKDKSKSKDKSKPPVIITETLVMNELNNLYFNSIYSKLKKNKRINYFYLCADLHQYQVGDIHISTTTDEFMVKQFVAGTGGSQLEDLDVDLSLVKPGDETKMLDTVTVSYTNVENIATYGFLDCSLTSDEEFNCVFVEAVMSNFNVKTFKGGYYSKGNNKFLKKKTIRKNKKNTRKNKKNSRKNNKKKSRKV